ncbi:MAG: choice-of-anchor E domain-containing protein [Pseudomonadota bacterium]
MRPLNLTALTLACVLGAAAAGHSATISDTDFVNDGETVTFLLSPDTGRPTSRSFERNNQFADEALTLNAFDAGLGTLTGVALTIRSLSASSLDYTPRGGCTDSGRDPSCARAELVVDNPFGSQQVQIFSQRFDLAFRRPAGDRTFDVTRGNSVNSFGIRSGSPLTFQFTNDLDRFVGSSPLIFPLLNSFAVDLRLNCDASILASVETCSGGVDMEVFNSIRADITYTYDVAAPPPPPVPLPAAGWMLLAGLGGMFALRRRG